MTLIPDRVAMLIARFSGREVPLADLLCDQYPADRIAYRIVSADLGARDLTYGELTERSERFAAALSEIGIGPGDRVATLMGKSAEYLIVLMGIWRLGAVHVPLFTAFAPPAIAFRLLGSGAKAVVCDPSQRSKLEPGESIPVGAPWQVITTGPADDIALAFDALMASASQRFPASLFDGDSPLIHIYTSGTTGNPKGVVVPVRALASFQAYGEFGLGLTDVDTYWCAADPGWAYGLYFGVLVTFLTGVRSVLLEANFSPDLTMAVLGQERVTNFAAAPTVFRALRGAEAGSVGTLNLRCASSAGEPLTPEVNEWAERALGVIVHDHYGQTEAGMLINNHHHPLLSGEIKSLSMGKAMPGWTAVILDDNRDEEIGRGHMGRLAMRVDDSPLAWFAGYAGDEARSDEKFAGGGRWYLTGDTAMIDDDGYFTFSARDDDVIIMAGYRIGPFEVESTLSTHPSVAESAVIAVPDAMRGEVIEAFVVVREGHDPTPALEIELQQWVKRRFAAHAYPRAVHFIAAMPKTPSGKIQRYVLKQQRLDELANGSRT